MRPWKKQPLFYQEDSCSSKRKVWINREPQNMLLEPQRWKPSALRSCALLHSTADRATARRDIIAHHSLLGGMQQESGIYVVYHPAHIHILGWLENFFVERHASDN
jgi:hypothetical protein